MASDSPIAVTWVSFNHDPWEREKDGSYRLRNRERTPGPALEFITNRASPAFGRVGKLVLFARRPSIEEPSARPTDPREEDVVRALQSALGEMAPKVQVEVRWWDTDAPPTDHRGLFPFVARSLASIRSANPRSEILVNISPGTPAMQTVMLLALQARLAGDNVRAFQGTPPDKRRTSDDVLREVPWNLLAELSATPIEEGPVTRRPDDWDLSRSRSARLREVAALVERFGGCPFPVLIVGARGTGKTEVARRLRDAFLEWTMKGPTPWHYHLNCGEFRGDPNMLRSALFGETKGAHSRAERDRRGLLEEAADDCVLLDEIHLMDPQAQGLLLLALQRHGSFRRLGGREAIPASFRLIAATNRPPPELREALLPDFLDRISDLVITVPELRDCREDLPEIWHSVVRRACDELLERDATRAEGSTATSKVASMIAEFKPHNPRIERAIGSMRLPGNFRDLERLARRLLVAGLARARFFSLSESTVTTMLEQARRDERVDDGSRSGPHRTLLDELPTPASCEDFLRETRNAGRSFSSPEAVDAWERRLLEAARAVAGSGAKAAALLGLAPRTFNAKMERLGHDE